MDGPEAHILRMVEETPHSTAELKAKLPRLHPEAVEQALGKLSRAGAVVVQRLKWRPARALPEGATREPGKTRELRKRPVAGKLWCGTGKHWAFPHQFQRRTETGNYRSYCKACAANLKRKRYHETKPK